jgi:hypothetical protein
VQREWRFRNTQASDQRLQGGLGSDARTSSDSLEVELHETVLTEFIATAVRDP